MARPIKETPILTGSDAERFVKEMQRVENLSSETRKANKKKLMLEFETAKKYYNLHINNEAENIRLLGESSE